MNYYDDDDRPSKLTKEERAELAALMNLIHWSSAQRNRVNALKSKALSR